MAHLGLATLLVGALPAQIEAVTQELAERLVVIRGCGRRARHLKVVVECALAWHQARRLGHIRALPAGRHSEHSRVVVP